MDSREIIYEFIQVGNQTKVSAIDVISGTEAVSYTHLDVYKRQNYDRAFKTAIEDIKKEGRYRVFTTLRRYQGDFPNARWNKEDGDKEVVVWC